MAAESRFADVRKELEDHGWSLVRINGSHHIFQGEHRPTLSIPVHKWRGKAGYVRRVRKIIEEVEA